MPVAHHAAQGPRGTTHGKALPRVPLAKVTPDHYLSPAAATTTVTARHPRHACPSPPPSGARRTPSTSRGPPGRPRVQTKKHKLRLVTYLRCSLGSLRDLFVSVSDRLVRGRHCGCFPWCRRDVHTRPISNQLMAAVHAATSPLIGWPPGSCSDVTLTSHIFLFFHLQIFIIQIIYLKP